MIVGTDRIKTHENQTLVGTACTAARTITLPDPGADARVQLETGAAADRRIKVARVALAAADTAGGLFSWVNPESTAIIVTQVLLDVTTQTSGACTADVGMTATSATTSADNLIDGKSLATAGLFDNIEDQGTNGTSRQKVAAGKWVTGSVASGASAGLVGFAYIHYYAI